MELSKEASFLSVCAGVLSRDLSDLKVHCGHEETSIDITNIANELELLASTLLSLHEAMSGDEDQYTPAFKQDLDELTRELKLVFDEVSDCCKEMQKADNPNRSTVGWFFKKGRVAKLHKYLATLKTTLIVMRTVLSHGKEYGVQNSPGRLAESFPHTMSEDRVILESVFAKNRDAIIDLHNLDKAHSRDNTSSTTSNNDPILEPGALGSKLSSATGIEIPKERDVLPTVYDTPQHVSGIDRRFSKRGVRLGVHASILDLGAHDAPVGLKKRWLQEAREHQGRPRYTQLSRISENEGDKVIPSAQPILQSIEINTEPSRSPTHVEASSGNKSKASLLSPTSPSSKSIGRIVHRLAHKRTEN